MNWVKKWVGLAALVVPVSLFGQRIVPLMVGTNGVLASPTNFWAANSNALQQFMLSLNTNAAPYDAIFWVGVSNAAMPNALVMAFDQIQLTTNGNTVTMKPILNVLSNGVVAVNFPTNFNFSNFYGLTLVILSNSASAGIAYAVDTNKIPTQLDLSSALAGLGTRFYLYGSSNTYPSFTNAVEPTNYTYFSLATPSTGPPVTNSIVISSNDQYFWTAVSTQQITKVLSGSAVAEVNAIEQTAGSLSFHAEFWLYDGTNLVKLATSLNQPVNDSLRRHNFFGYVGYTNFDVPCRLVLRLKSAEVSGTPTVEIVTEGIYAGHAGITESATVVSSAGIATLNGSGTNTTLRNPTLYDGVWAGTNTPDALFGVLAADDSTLFRFSSAGSESAVSIARWGAVTSIVNALSGNISNLYLPMRFMNTYIGMNSEGANAVTFTNAEGQQIFELLTNLVQSYKPLKLSYTTADRLAIISADGSVTSAPSGVIGQVWTFNGTSGAWSNSAGGSGGSATNAVSTVGTNANNAFSTATTNLVHTNGLGTLARGWGGSGYARIAYDLDTNWFAASKLSLSNVAIASALTFQGTNLITLITDIANSITTNVTQMSVSNLIVTNFNLVKATASRIAFINANKDLTNSSLTEADIQAKQYGSANLSNWAGTSTNLWATVDSLSAYLRGSNDVQTYYSTLRSLALYSNATGVAWAISNIFTAQTPIRIVASGSSSTVYLDQGFNSSIGIFSGAIEVGGELRAAGGVKADSLLASNATGSRIAIWDALKRLTNGVRFEAELALKTNDTFQNPTIWNGTWLGTNEPGNDFRVKSAGGDRWYNFYGFTGADSNTVAAFGDLTNVSKALSTALDASVSNNLKAILQPAHFLLTNIANLTTNGLPGQVMVATATGVGWSNQPTSSGISAATGTNISKHVAGTEIWYNVEDYGAVHDGVTDDTAAIQAALNAAGGDTNLSRSATIYFPPGIYLIAGSPTNTFNSQLAAPILKSDTVNWSVFTLLGSAPPESKTGSSIANTFPQHGTIIKTTMGAAYNTNCVFYCPAAYTIVVRNMKFEVPGDFNSTVLQFTNCANACLYDISLHQTNCGSSATFPGTNSVGIEMPRKDMASKMIVSGVDIGGFYRGITYTEHGDTENLQINGCVRGITFRNGNHKNVFKRVLLQGCEYSIYVEAASRFDFQSVNIERLSADWRTNIADYVDSNNGYGFINWRVYDNADHLKDHKLVVSGGERVAFYENTEDPWGGMQVAGSTISPSYLRGPHWYYYDNSARDAGISIMHSRGTPGVPAAVTKGDGIGSLKFLGHDGTTWIQGASIQATVDNTVSTTNMPTLLSLATSPSNAAGLVGRIVIGSAGQITNTGPAYFNSNVVIVGPTFTHEGTNVANQTYVADLLNSGTNGALTVASNAFQRKLAVYQTNGTANAAVIDLGVNDVQLSVTNPCTKDTQFNLYLTNETPGAYFTIRFMGGSNNVAVYTTAGCLQTWLTTNYCWDASLTNIYNTNKVIRLSGRVFSTSGGMNVDLHAWQQP